jgi:hypothetical protein
LEPETDCKQQIGNNRPETKADLQQTDLRQNRFYKIDLKQNRLEPKRLAPNRI